MSATSKDGVEETIFEPKDSNNPRPRTDFLRTDPLEAKYKNGQDQGPWTQFF